MKKILNWIADKLYGCILVPKTSHVYDRDTRIFALSSMEKESADRIYKKYGTIQYTFTPTGIGDVVEVTVLGTGKIINITDYLTW